MHTPQLDPSVSSTSLHPPCRHMRLVDRILTENGQETDKVRCVECGDIIAAHTLWRPNDTASDRP